MASLLFYVAFCVFVLSAAKAEEDSTEFGQSPGIKNTNCTCGRTNKEQGRIVGGVEAGVNEYPLMVGIRKRYLSIVFCGGTIITPYHVLTAAHCTQHNKFFFFGLSVVVGDHNLYSDSDTKHARVIHVEKIIDHEDYDDYEAEMDISLLLVEEEMYKNEDKYIGPACFPISKPVDLVEETVKVIGWGLTLENGAPSDVLRKANLKVVPLKICDNHYGINVAQASQLCTYMKNKDACQGDSGGPVLWRDPQTNRYTIVGLVSYGDGCAANNIPGVNTDVQFHRDWILQKIEETKPGTKTCQKV